MIIHSKQSGYTLLFAVLVSVLVLGVAVFISGIARKQYILSSTALDSMYSFYAADSGIECVAYNAASLNILSSSTVATFNCAGNSISLSSSSYVPWSPASIQPLYPNQSPTDQLEFTFNLGFYSGSTRTGCAKVSIDIYDDTSGEKNIIVQSRGYNLCTGSSGSYGPDTSSPRTVERALQLNTEL